MNYTSIDEILHELSHKVELNPIAIIFSDHIEVGYETEKELKNNPLTKSSFYGEGFNANVWYDTEHEMYIALSFVNDIWYGLHWKDNIDGLISEVMSNVNETKNKS